MLLDEITQELIARDREDKVNWTNKMSKSNL